jgi:hypothetical protein
MTQHICTHTAKRVKFQLSYNYVHERQKTAFGFPFSEYTLLLSWVCSMTSRLLVPPLYSHEHACMYIHVVHLHLDACLRKVHNHTLRTYILSRWKFAPFRIGHGLVELCEFGLVLKMYVCMCVCMCVFMCTYIWICEALWAWPCEFGLVLKMYVCMYIFVCVFMCTHTWIREALRA